MYEGCKKYQPFPSVDLKDRRWPDARIEKAPVWCSVDLRDGNQALVNPMNLEEKIRFFHPKGVQVKPAPQPAEAQPAQV